MSTAIVLVKPRSTAAGAVAFRRALRDRAIDVAPVELALQFHLEALEPRRMMSAGPGLATVALDPTFGTGGYAAFAAPSTAPINIAEVASIVPAPDGSVYVEANLYAYSDSAAILPFPNGQIGIAHFRADGSPDVSFGNGGWAMVPVGTDYTQGEGKLKLLPDGKLLIFEGGDNGFDVPISVTRLNADGSPDATFGNGGTAVLPDALGDQWVAGLRPQYSQVWVDGAGKVNLFGLVDVGGGAFVSTWARLNADGTPDTSWAADGVRVSAPAQAVTPPEPGLWSPGRWPLDAKPRPGGGVIAYVESDYSDDTQADLVDTVVSQVQIDATGAIVSHVELPSPAATSDPQVVEQADGGAYVVVGTEQLLHVTPDGTVDVNVDMGDAAYDEFFFIAVQPDGKVLAMGLNPSQASAIRRFNADGTPDLTFAGGGAVYGLPGSGWITGAGLPDGSVVLGVAVSSENTVRLAKLLPIGGAVDDGGGGSSGDNGTDLLGEDPSAFGAARGGAVFASGESPNGFFDAADGATLFDPDGTDALA